VMSCQKRTETTSDGIEYTFIKEGEEKPNVGEYVVYHFTAKTADDSTFISSYDQPTPAYMQYNEPAEGVSGIDEVFSNLRKGDSVVVQAAAEKVFGPNLPPFLALGQDVTISIGVVEILKEEVFQDYFNDLFEASQQKQTDTD